jgi:hypothetical protein
VGAEKVTALPGRTARFAQALTGYRFVAAIDLVRSVARSCLGGRDGIRDREQLGIVSEQLDHFPIERQLAVR